MDSGDGVEIGDVANHGPTAEADPEFRTPILGPPAALNLDPAAYQRLVSNPFLGFVAIGVWIAACYSLLVGHIAGRHSPILALGLMPLLWAFPRLFHVHCLDCGATSRLLSWQRHACAPVVERARRGRPRRFRGPTPPLQVVVWIWVLFLLMILTRVARSSSR